MAAVTEALAEQVEERAAIREFEAGLPRDLAEDLALLEVLRAHRLGCSPGACRCDETLSRPLGCEQPSARTDARRRPQDGDFIDFVMNMPVTNPPPPFTGPGPDLWPGWQTDPLWWASIKKRWR